MKKWLLVLLITSSTYSFAEDLDEAQGLGDDTMTVEMKPQSQEQDRFRFRSYVLAEAAFQSLGSVQTNTFPNLEGSLSADYKTDFGLTTFADGIVTYTTSKTQVFVNQLGLRYQATEQLNVAVGKERNRRSPGIIISPSDLLLPLSQLPGLREDRRGVWLGRLSYQTPHSSYDLMAVPRATNDDFGWPTGTQFYGEQFRTLQQFDNLDVSLSLANLNNISKAGLAIQLIAAKVWKLYYDGAFEERYTNLLGIISTNISQHLLGMSWEGSDKFGVRAEFFLNGEGMSSADIDTIRLFSSSLSTSGFTPFLRKQYGILSFSATEIAQRYNFFVSAIKSLEDGALLALGRAEWLINDHMVTGITATFVSGGSDTQYFLKQFDQKFQIDAKYTF